MIISADDYEYSTSWSDEDSCYIARVAEFELLGTHGDTEEKAISSIKGVVNEVLLDMVKRGETPPIPLSKRKPKPTREEIGKEAERIRSLSNQMIADLVADMADLLPMNRCRDNVIDRLIEAQTWSSHCAAFWERERLESLDKP